MIPKLNKSNSLDELIQYVTLHVPIVIFFNGTILPFVLIYLLTFYLWFFVYNTDDGQQSEVFVITITILIAIHILTLLCCFWSVHFQTFLNFRRVSLCFIKFIAFMLIYRFRLFLTNILYVNFLLKF